MSNTKAFTYNIATNNETQKVIFKVLISSFVVLSCVYVYLIGSITFNVLARKSLEGTMRDIGTHVGQLELSYLSESSTVDKNFALSIGFVDATKPIFASSNTLSNVAMR